jgi:hypothetical protein
LADGGGEVISIVIEWKICLEDALDCTLKMLPRFGFAAQCDSAVLLTNFGKGRGTTNDE